MTAQQLRNSILQQAIQGRLVPQDPNDEPASVLLERIRKEKELLVKEGKLKKKDLATTPIADDEKPFDIPSGWEWARLGDCMDVRDGTHDTPKYTPSGIPLVTSKNLKNGRIDLSEVKFISKEDSDSINLRSNVDNEDILFAMIGSIGNPVLVKKEYEFSIKNMALFKKVGRFLFMPYIWHMLFFLQNDMRAYASGAVQSFVSLSYLRNYPFPLPPLAEQRRIVAKIEELMPLVEKYGKAQTELDTLNQDLPRRLRQSVLQQAIQGKLVEQDEKEGNASELLLRLREVRRNKIKSGEIKLSKPEKALKIEISNDFDLPSSWTWCVLNDVCRAFGRIGFRGYTKEDIVSSKEEGAIAISPSNMENLRLNFNKCTYITEAKYQESPEIMVENGDVLLTKTASVGKLALVENLPWKATINPQIAVLKEISIDNKYLTYVLASPYIQDIIHGFTIGTSIPTYSQEKMLGINIPLPPLAEQRRIVAKIEELFAEIDKLK